MTTSHDPDDSFHIYIFFFNLYSLILLSNSSNLHSCILASFFLYFLTRSRNTKYCTEFSVFFFILYPVLLLLFSFILYPVSCILYHVSCALYHLFCILHPVSFILYPSSCIIHPLSLILNHLFCITFLVFRILHPKNYYRSLL